MGRPKKADGGTGTVRSVTRALAILERLTEAEEGVSLSNLAPEMGLPVSTVHRLLLTLQDAGFAEFDGESRTWRVGLKAFMVGSAFRRSQTHSRTARPFMRRLMMETGETVNLAALEGDEIVYLAQVECDQLMRVIARPGSNVPLHCSAVGKAFLAAMPERDARNLLSRRGMIELTPKTRTHLPGLFEELETVRWSGFATDDEEHTIGVRCAASIIHNEYGEPVMALSVSGPTTRIPAHRLAQLGKAVLSVARELERAVGGRAPEDQPQQN